MWSTQRRPGRQVHRQEVDAGVGAGAGEMELGFKVKLVDLML